MIDKKIVINLIYISIKNHYKFTALFENKCIYFTSVMLVEDLMESFNVKSNKYWIF